MAGRSSAPFGWHSSIAVTRIYCTINQKENTIICTRKVGARNGPAGVPKTTQSKQILKKERHPPGPRRRRKIPSLSPMEIKAQNSTIRYIASESSAAYLLPPPHPHHRAPFQSRQQGCYCGVLLVDGAPNNDFSSFVVLFKDSLHHKQCICFTNYHVCHKITINYALNSLKFTHLSRRDAQRVLMAWLSPSP